MPLGWEFFLIKSMPGRLPAFQTERLASRDNDWLVPVCGMLGNGLPGPLVAGSTVLDKHVLCTYHVRALCRSLGSGWEIDTALPLRGLCVPGGDGRKKPESVKPERETWLPGKGETRGMGRTCRVGEHQKGTQDKHVIANSSST